MNKDLFGNDLIPEKSIQSLYLKDMDDLSLDQRVKRLEYLHKINPDGMAFMGEMEMVFSFREAQNCFIAGHFLSTIVLAQAFIEKIFHAHFEENNLGAIGKKGLSEMLKYCKTHEISHEYVLQKVDWIRLIRNPITHLKALDYNHSLHNRAYNNKENPLIQIENDAKEAISIMTYIALNGIKK